MSTADRLRSEGYALGHAEGKAEAKAEAMAEGKAELLLTYSTRASAPCR